MSRCAFIAALTAIALSILAAAGATALPSGQRWHVDMNSGDDASGDGSQGNPFASIRRAIFACADGDSIVVGPGTYTGPDNRDLDFGLLDLTICSERVWSEEVSDSSIIDCEGTGNAFNLSEYASDYVIHGFTIQNAGGAGIGAAAAYERIGEIKDCIVQDCQGPGMNLFATDCVVSDCIVRRNGGNGIMVWECAGSIARCVVEDNAGIGIEIYCPIPDIEVVDCEIRGNQSRGLTSGGCGSVNLTRCNIADNHSSFNGAGLFFWPSGNTHSIVECVFSGNESDLNGGAIYFYDYPYIGQCLIEDCLFYGNSAQAGGALYFYPWAFEYTLRNCSVVDNQAPIGSGICSDYLFIGEVAIENCVVAYNAGGVGVEATVAATLPSLSCCDVFGNEGGEYGAYLGNQTGMNGNISADPIFCDRSTADYSLYDLSPCLPENNGCGILLGALEQGCAAAILAPLPAVSDPIGCSGSRELSFHYSPQPSTPGVRAYSIRVLAGEALQFSASDIVVHELPAGESGVSQITQNAPNDFTVDYTVLGDSEGILSEADLFDISFHGDVEGDGDVSIEETDFRGSMNERLVIEHSAGAVVSVDCTAPGPAAELSSSPGHDEIQLSWNDPSDPDLAGVEIWRARWNDAGAASAYPEYDDLPDDVIPERPADRAAADSDPAWVLAATVPAGTGTWTDALPERGVYYHEAFPLDLAGNYAAPAEAGARATSYRLGDVRHPYDGLVNAGDVTVLGAAYGVGEGHPAYNAECDVGPTDDGTGRGIPVTDNWVDFEDLSIFSDNYGEQGSLPSREAEREAGPDAASAALTWTEREAGCWSLSLAQPCEGLKGLRLWSEDAVELLELQRGELLDRQRGPVFLQNTRMGGLDLGLMILGRGLGLTGKGELLRLRVAGDGEPEAVQLDLRGLGNVSIDYRLNERVEESLPESYALYGNWPNPFNPETRIVFALPETQRVELSIMTAAGRHLRTLLARELPAGRHEVIWDGRDAAGVRQSSGLYLYRIEAGPLRETRKLTLLK